eukprot:gene10745-17820_t
MSYWDLVRDPLVSKPRALPFTNSSNSSNGGSMSYWDLVLVPLAFTPRSLPPLNGSTGANGSVQLSVRASRATSQERAASARVTAASAKAAAADARRSLEEASSLANRELGGGIVPSK